MCHFLGGNLISWSSRKQNSVALSSTKAEYITVGSYCAQSLWIKYQLEDYRIQLDKVIIRCDNKSTICLSKNSILHSRTKHIDVRYHFIKKHVSNSDIMLNYVSTDDQLVDIFTKPLSEEMFSYLRRELEIFWKANDKVLEFESTRSLCRVDLSSRADSRFCASRLDIEKSDIKRIEN